MSWLDLEEGVAELFGDAAVCLDDGLTVVEAAHVLDCPEVLGGRRRVAPRHEPSEDGWRLHYRSKDARERLRAECFHCGADMPAFNSRGRMIKYCSKRCKQREWRGSPRPERLPKLPRLQRVYDWDTGRWVGRRRRWDELHHRWVDVDVEIAIGRNHAA